MEEPKFNPPISKSKILVVDDDERIVQTFSRNLTLEGYTVLTALDGAEAVALYTQEQPDIVLTDVRMPQLDGFGVLATIRARNPEAEVILVTGHGDLDMTIAALRAGASDFIIKPVDKATLLAALRRAHERLQLRHELHLTQAALQEERASLAARVAERTAELNAANAELSRAARLKDEFLANMSHELRTPLNAVLGMAEVLHRELYGPLNEKQQEYVHTIEESGRHLLTLINEILDLSKIEAGTFDLELAPVPVAELCRESLWLLRLMAAEKQIEMTYTLDSAVTTLQGDRRRLKQILVNLLSNALKFTPAGGRVGLEVAGDAACQAVHFTVWDTGVGIAAEDIARLFQPFTQLDSGLARQHEGAGLGLALVYRLAELHGGSVNVYSQVGGGSRFTISLPWRPVAPLPAVTPPAAPVRAAAPAAARRSLKILLAEDHQASIETFVSYLQALQHCVIVAHNGLEAIERAREECPDLILMDIRMPGLDGLEAIRRIRADAALKVIPIIALTALTMPGDLQRCLAAGADMYLSKPVSMEQLTQVIQAQMAKRESPEEIANRG